MRTVTRTDYKAPRTPPPYDVMEDPRGRLVHVETAIDNPAGAGMPICSIPVKRSNDADFIVEACNNYHIMKAEIDRLRKVLYDIGHDTAIPTLEKAQRYSTIRLMAREALKP